MENNRHREESDNNKNEKKHSSAASIDNIIGSATGNVRSHTSSGTLGNTGTNISYEGATAPGGGGSAGTGYASGQEATGSGITNTSSDTAESGKEQSKAEKLTKSDDKDDDLDRDTIGTP